MVGDDVTGPVEPPGRELVEHLALVRHAGDDPVERREAIGGDEQPLSVREGVRHADLAVAAIVERQVDVAQGCGRGEHQRSAA